MAGTVAAEADNSAGSRSVRDAVNVYGERIPVGKREKSKTEEAFQEQKLPSKARELHIARRDIGRFKDDRRNADTVRAEAESELSNAVKTLKDLSLRIEEANMKAKARKQEIQGLRKPERLQAEWAVSAEEANNLQYLEVMRELEAVKQELNSLKLDMAVVLEAKMQAEKQIEYSTSGVHSFSSSVEALTKEIEKTNEEEVLVELAKIEAVRELGAIESQREAEAAHFSKTMEKTKNRIKDLIEEFNHSKELEKQLEITTSDVNALQDELKLVKGHDRNSENNSEDSSNQPHSLAAEIYKRREEETVTASLLQSAKVELNEARKELASVKQEGFQFMASMDIIRNELKHISGEIVQLKKIEEQADSTVQNLNSKLLRANSKLEAASKAEEKARTIVSNLSETLKQLQTEKEAAKKEKELISKETENIKLQIQKAESKIELEEERLQAALQELEAVKRSEAIALESLKSLTEKTMRARASSSLHNSTITISRFEYKYLTQRAEGAEEIADKKVAAAQAWIEALKAGEKEILMKTKIAHRGISEIRVVEEHEIYKTEKALAATKVAEGELSKWRKYDEQMQDGNLPLKSPLPRKPMKDNGNPMTPRRTRNRRPASPGARTVIRSSSFTLRKKRKVVPNLVKFFSSKKAGKQS